MSAFEKIIDSLHAHGDTVNLTGQGKARGHCPAHNGTSDDSLAIGPRDDGKGIIIHCHAGCSYTDVLDAISLKPPDLFDDAQLQNVWKPFAKYTYPGGLEVNRKIGQNGKKTFHQSGKKTDRSLYHADQIGSAMVIYVPEGEKDVLAIEAIGGTAVCSAMGAGKAHIADWSPLTGKHVIIIADKDEPGLNHAEGIADILDGIAITVSVVRAAVGKDVSDHIAAGKKLSDLVTVTGFADTDPIPLVGNVKVPPFPIEAFPKAITDMVTELAEFTQTDLAMAGTSAIAALSACAGGNVEIQIRDGWLEPLCTYSATVADSGERKSAVQKPMLQPVFDAEAELVEDIMPQRVEAIIKRDIAEKALVITIAKAAKTIPFTPEWHEAQTAAISTQKEIDANQVPELPRLVADDVTPEAVASLLADCGGSIAVISAEGGVFDIIAGRYSGNIPNMDVWLKSHSGDPIRVDRKGRPPEFIRKPAMTLGLMIQPEVLKTIAAQPTFRGRGLLARFLYAMPVSNIGYRRTNAPSVSETVLKTYSVEIKALAKGLVKKRDSVLKLSAQAASAIETIEAETERALREDGALANLHDWGGKYVAAVARISGLLHLAEHGVNGLTIEITADTISAAADLGTYYRFGALRAFEVMATDPSIADAVYLLGRLKLHSTAEISERDMQRAAQKFAKKADLLAAVDILVDYGWLQAKATPQQTGKGRPASPTYKIHPLTKVAMP